jgi:hypothetical protein
MKNTNSITQRNRSFRRLVKKWFSSFIKRQDCDCRAELEKISERLQNIEDSIEIIARQMARWAQINPGG